MADVFLSPNASGVGLKPVHFEVILSTNPKIGFFEIHAENYMEEGGPPHFYLSEISTRYPLSLHGVGLSIGGEDPLDKAHLQRLAALNTRYKPVLFSEHLAWSSHEGVYFNELLPLPYTETTLARVIAHIQEVQDTLGRRMLLENPSRYAVFSESTLPEPIFLERIVQATGCGLLLDLNNVFISAKNLGLSAKAYVADFPLAHVGEIHLGGHAERTDAQGAPLLIDSHDRLVAPDVWNLFAFFLERAGPRPTLIEWDQDLPDWDMLAGEATRAQWLLDGVRTKDPNQPIQDNRE